MALVIIIGIVMGVASFLPLWGSLKATQHITSTSNFSHASTLLLAVLGSVAILFGSAVICIYVDRADIFSFAVGEAVGIVVIAITFGVQKLVRRKNQQ